METSKETGPYKEKQKKKIQATGTKSLKNIDQKTRGSTIREETSCRIHRMDKQKKREHRNLIISTGKRQAEESGRKRLVEFIGWTHERRENTGT